MCVHILGWKCMSLSLSVYCPSMLRFFSHVLPCIHAMHVHREINTYAEALWSHQLISCIYYGLCFYLHLFSACPNMSSCPALMSGSQNTAVLWQEWYKILSPTQGCSWRTSLSAVGRHHFFQCSSCDIMCQSHKIVLNLTQEFLMPKPNNQVKKSSVMS